MSRSNRPRRFGVVKDDVELENRLLAIERELAKLTPIDTFLDSKTRRMVIKPPQITGVVLQTSPGTITVQWDKLNVTNISFYEVWVATNAAFTGTVKKAKVQEDFFTYQDATADDLTSTFYTRVRAVINNKAGLWSSTISSGLGLSDTFNLSPNSVTALTEETITSFTPPTQSVSAVTTSSAESYGSLSVTSTSDGTIAPRISWQGTIEIVTPTGELEPVELKFELKRNPGNVTVGTFVQTFPQKQKPSVHTFNGWAEYDDPGAGTWSYSTDVTVTGTGAVPQGTGTITHTRLFTQVVEFRR